ncbi:hypothetical protein COV58_03440, partial [Candidatus Roizmanbacteria bacterium CG11_big_fil_rev_8_21_14_0_20_36_8]
HKLIYLDCGYAQFKLSKASDIFLPWKEVRVLWKKERVYHGKKICEMFKLQEAKVIKETQVGAVNAPMFC